MITFENLRRHCKAYQSEERRDPTYRVATLFISQFWGNPVDIADGLGVLLLVWNQAFYRYGQPDFRLLKSVVTQHMKQIEDFRKRTILDFDLRLDGPEIVQLFGAFLGPLAARKHNSPVATAKAIHLLAPDYLPLWDDKIARAYRCHWKSSGHSAQEYLDFTERIADLCRKVVNDYSKQRGIASREAAMQEICRQCTFDGFRRSLPKVIDEYNYVKYVKPWFLKENV